MKKVALILIMLTGSLKAQHMGNFNNQIDDLAISRANIATAGSNNGYQNKRIVPGISLSPSKTLNHNIRALYNIEATDYTAVFNINQIGATAQQTTKFMEDKINLIKSKLSASGFKGQFAVDMISFLPQYEIEVTKKLFSKTYTEVPIGFELQQNLLISYRNDADFQKILAACATAEVYNLVKVDYYVKNLEAVYNQLQEKILEEVGKKKAYYEALGFDMELYDVHMADQKYYHVPKDFYKSYVAAENISMEALTDDKNITRIKKPTSYYYDPISYNGYDIVVNADIHKPVIQLGMDLSLRYTLKPVEQPKPKPTPAPKTVTKTYVISANGKIDIKQLPDS
ncbi:MAG: hypothetical protein WBA16_08505 [Nonlabens sp.]